MFQQATVSSSLDDFYNNGLITDVVREVKSGKEASVYLCRANPSCPLVDLQEHEWLAAKVYRPSEGSGWGNDALRAGRQQARFRNDSVYQAGRVILNRRDNRAYQKKTRHGEAVRFGYWINAEWETINELNAAGADVPRPIWRSENAILMEYIGDEEMPAPKLNEVPLERDEAMPLFRRLLRNVELFLDCDRVHADFSPFNILFWEGTVKVIDFPQAVDARSNPNALMLLERDLTNLCRFFERYGVRDDGGRLARAMWSRFRRGELG